MKSIPDTLDLQSIYDELLMIPRSITGEGYRRSLEILSRYIPFELEYYPSGSQVLDWTVPPEWHLERAVLKDSRGRIILDSDTNPLYVLNYSTGFQGTVTREELEEHLYTDDRNPEQIPYVTSYYKDRWGFCLSEKMKADLTDTHYQVDIRAAKDPHGNVVIATCDLPGMSDRIVQISTYLCHPNMLNNELSGPLTVVLMYLMLAALPKQARRYTCRFVINPETIGSICYLSRHADELREKLEYGMTVNCTASFYANEYVGRFARIKPLDLSKLKAHLEQDGLCTDIRIGTAAALAASVSACAAATPATAAASAAYVTACGRSSPATAASFDTACGSGTPATAAAADCACSYGRSSGGAFGAAAGSSHCCAGKNPLYLRITADSDAMTCFNDLVDQVRSCRQNNFLPVPVTLKMSRQSLRDEISWLLSPEGRASQARAGEMDSDPAQVCAVTSPDLERALTVLSERERREFCLHNGALHKELSNEDRLKLMLWAVNSRQKSFSSLKIHKSPHTLVQVQAKMSSPVNHTVALLERCMPEDFRSVIFISNGGADERQYNAALLNLPVISALRVPYNSYSEYHSSHDSQELFSLDSVVDSALMLVNFMRFYERRDERVSAVIGCEPQLGRRGLYHTINCHGDARSMRNESVFSVSNILNLLCLADGTLTIEELAQVSDIRAFDLIELIDHLAGKGVLAWAAD